MRFSAYLFVIMITLCTGCGKSSEERSLEKRTEKLDTRERELQTREQELALRETAVKQLQHKLDSMQSEADTIGVHEPALIGLWKVTMNCIETNCEGSAIGDTKTEQWKISYQDGRVVAEAMNKNTTIRIYTGLFRENTLRMAAPETTGQDTHMNVVLVPHPTSKGLMQGERIIARAGTCRTVYTLKAEKQ